LKKTLPLQAKGRIRKPGAEEQRQNDLGDKTHHPHDHGIFKINRQIAVLKNRNKVFDSHKIRTDLRQAGSVVFEQGIVYRGHQRYHLKHEIDHNKRD
jgi:hypothetical protein